MGRNFFGKSFKLELSMANINKEKTAVIVKGANQALLQRFYMTFISAKFNRTMVNLQTEAKKRAVRRKDNIVKRVDAGILEKVDAYRAEIAVMAKEEDIKNARFTLNENLQDLSTGVHRKVLEPEVPYFSLRRVLLPGDIKGNVESNFKMAEKKKEINFIRENLKKINRGFLPDINIRLSYKTEGSGFELKDTLDEGNLTNGGKLAGAVSLVIPLGYEQNKVDQASKRIALNKQRYEIKNLRSELDNMDQGLKDRVQIIRKNIASATKRRRISAKTLKEQNSLYLKGRAPLDTVVIAEEQLILNEMRLAQFLLQLEQILVSQSILYGNLESYLLSRGSN
jgi:outer membrane protein TolC